jgi:hypothetical protein
LYENILKICVGLEPGETSDGEDRKIDQDRVIYTCAAAGMCGRGADPWRVSAGRECSEKYETVLLVFARKRREVQTNAVRRPRNAGASGVYSRAGGGGKYVVVGPALDAGRIGGMAIINAASAEEAKKIVNGDKMVQSGELVAEIHPVMLADLSALHIEYPAKTDR